MRDSLKKYVGIDDVTRHKFAEWITEADNERRRTAITLLNYQLLWRGEKEHKRCCVVRHDGTHKLVFEVSDKFEMTQQTLTGKDVGDRAKERVNGYVVVFDMGKAVAHRYTEPRVKQYSEDFYAFFPTGWLFTRRGEGEQVIEGDDADDLHNDLGKNTRERVTNKRSQFRQWRDHFRVAEETESDDYFAPEESQRMRLESLSFELPERPPKDAEEQNILMEGNQVD